MHKAIKCFNVAKEVIDEANIRFSPSLVIDEERICIFEEYCNAIDILVNEYDGESLEVEVNESDLTISIRIECMSMEVNKSSHVYYDLIQRAVKFGFKNAGNGNIIIEFSFPSLWRNVL